MYRRKTFTPYRRKLAKKPYYKKKATFRRKPYHKATVSKVALGASDRIMVKLPYSDVYTFSGSYNPSAQVWRTNSLFDPDLTNVGHQPLGFDQYSAFYQKYIVHGCEIRLDIRNDTAVSVKGVLCFSDTDSSSASVQVASEYKYATPFTIGPNSSNNRIVLKRYMSEKKLHGLKTIENQETQQALISATPTDVGLVWLKVEALDGTTAVKVYADVRIKYYAVMFDLLNPAQS